jgi:hypothetical protein
VGREQFALDAAHILTPHVLLPVQVEQPADRWLRRLCLAVLEDALKCLGTHGRDQREAWEWIRSDAEHCCSFLTVCSVLHLHAGAVRRQLLRQYVGDEEGQVSTPQLRHPRAYAAVGNRRVRLK